MINNTNKNVDYIFDPANLHFLLNNELKEYRKCWIKLIEPMTFEKSNIKFEGIILALKGELEFNENNINIDGIPIDIKYSNNNLYLRAMYEREDGMIFPIIIDKYKPTKKNQQKQIK